VEALVDRAMNVERFGRAIIGGQFLQGLDVPTTARRLREGKPAPGMLSFAERAMLYELVRRTWHGDGAIVDGGSFFGSSLSASAEGMLASPALAGTPVDRFPEGKPIHG
jgi:hypothetical protein